MKESVYILENKVAMKGQDMTLFCDKLYLYSKEGEMEQVDAIGNVSLLSKGTLAKSTKAVYSLKEDRVVMTGSPRIVKDKVEMDGESVVYSIPEGKFSVNRPKMRIDRR